MPKRYKVELTELERSDLLVLTGKGKVSARRIKRALALLRSDEGATDEQIVHAVGVGMATVERIRKRWCATPASWSAAGVDARGPGEPSYCKRSARIKSRIDDTCRARPVVAVITKSLVLNVLRCGCRSDQDQGLGDLSAYVLQKRNHLGIPTE